MKQYAPGHEPRPEPQDDKLEAGEIELKGDFFSRLENFWFYHKWKVIIATAAILLVVIMSVQLTGNAKDDLTVLYAGSAYLSTAENYSDLVAALAEAMPTDYNGDGSKRLEIAAMNIYSEEQVKERENDKTAIPVNTYINTSEHNSYKMIMQTGEYSLCLLEEWLYDEIATGVFCKLSDVLGYQPEGAIDTCAVYFKDTDFYKSHAEAFSAIPDKTVICLRQPNSVGGKGSQEQYERAKETFVAILNFRSATEAE